MRAADAAEVGAELPREIGRSLNVCETGT